MTTEPPTTSSSIASNADAVACLTLATEGLKLLNDYRRDSRGIVGADEARYRADADTLRAEFAELGCRGELLKGFPAG